MKKILLYGNTLWFDGLATYLPNLAELHVTRLCPADLANLPAMPETSLILMDQTLEANALALMRHYPTAVMLSIDIATGKLTVLQSQTWQVNSVHDLAQFMRGVTAAKMEPLLLSPRG